MKLRTVSDTFPATGDRIAFTFKGAPAPVVVTSRRTYRATSTFAIITYQHPSGRVMECHLLYGAGILAQAKP